MLLVHGANVHMENERDMVRVGTNHMIHDAEIKQIHPLDIDHSTVQAFLNKSGAISSVFPRKW